VLGLRQGATENATVCVALLEDLQARGLDTSRPVLLVLAAPGPCTRPPSGSGVRTA